ncbi:MAG: hypothetical protein WC867_01310 [Candidatus Pacearchaeota archaeon]|jgi:hypothetical protein
MTFRQIKENIGKIAAIGIAAGAITYSSVIGQYMDVFGFDKDNEAGRTKNAIATVVSGIVSRDIYGESEFNFDVRKTLYPDSEVYGTTSKETLSSNMDLFLTSVRFSPKVNSEGRLEGVVEKSEFDWKLLENNEGNYDINRFGPKFDSRLKLDVGNGKINGVYERFGPHYDWIITGTYNVDGEVKMNIDIPRGLDLTLVGKVTKR